MRRGGRQQAVVPDAFEEKPLLRAVTQVALIGHVATRNAAQQAEIEQQLTHFVGVRPRQGQVVRTHRAAAVAQPVAAAVAAGPLFELQHDDVVDARANQCARTGQAGDAGADYQHIDALARSLRK